MWIVLCLVVGSITGLAMHRFVFKDSMVWRMLAVGVGGGLAGGVLERALADSQAPLGVGLWLAAFSGAVAAALLARSLRQPMGSY